MIRDPFVRALLKRTFTRKDGYKDRVHGGADWQLNVCNALIEAGLQGLPVTTLRKRWATKVSSAEVREYLEAMRLLGKVQRFGATYRATEKMLEKGEEDISWMDLSDC